MRGYRGIDGCMQEVFRWGMEGYRGVYRWSLSGHSQFIKGRQSVEHAQG